MRSPLLTFNRTGTFLTREIVSNPENANCAVEQFTYIGDVADDQIRNKLSVLATMVSEPMFDQLRSKEQLGYIVRPIRSGPIQLYLKSFVLT